MDIKIKNNLEKKINELQKNTGVTKKWIASQMNMTQQRLYYLFKCDNMMLDLAIKFSIFLKCDINELFEYEIIKQ